MTLASVGQGRIVLAGEGHTLLSACGRKLLDGHVNPDGYCGQPVMSKVIVLHKPACIEGPLPAVPLAQPVRESDLSHACLVDCIEDAMGAIAVRVHLLRLHDRRARENSPWTWKQLTRIENRLEELQIVLKAAGRRSR